MAAEALTSPVDDRNCASAEWLALVKSRNVDVVTRRHARLMKFKEHKRRKIGPQDWILTLKCKSRYQPVRYGFGWVGLSLTGCG
jgi:hypothetical protein